MTQTLKSEKPAGLPLSDLDAAYELDGGSTGRIVGSITHVAKVERVWYDDTLNGGDGGYFTEIVNVDIPANYTILPRLEDNAPGLIKPKWDGSAWVEDATQAEQDANLEDYKVKFKFAVDYDAQQKFLDLLGGNLYILIAHFIKGFEAIDYYNDNIKPAGEVDDFPRGYRPNSTDPSVKSHPVLEAEASSRGMSMTDLVNEVHPLTRTQWDLVRDIEKIRVKAKSDIDAAVDESGVDSIYSQWQTDIGNITIS